VGCCDIHLFVYLSVYCNNALRGGEMSEEHKPLPVAEWLADDQVLHNMEAERQEATRQYKETEQEIRATEKKLHKLKNQLFNNRQNCIKISEQIKWFKRKQ